MVKSVSCQSTRALCDYAQKRGVPRSDIFMPLSTLPHVLLDANQWITLLEWTTLVRRLCKLLQCTVFDLGRDLGRQMHDDFARMSLVRLLPWFVLKRVLPQLCLRRVNRNLCVSLLNWSEKARMIQVAVSPIDPEDYNEDVCQYNQGATVGLVEARGHLGVDLVHTQCMFRGAPCCESLVSWKERGVLPLQQLSRMARELSKRCGGQDELLREEGISIPITTEDVERLFKESDDG